MSEGRFNDEQSRMNCVSMSWVALHNSLELGKYRLTELRTSGRYLLRVSAVALHLVRTCTMSSAGAAGSESDWHSLQEGSDPLSAARLA